MEQGQRTPDPALEAAALEAASRVVAAAFTRGDIRHYDEGALARHVASLAARVLSEFRQRSTAHPGPDAG